MFVNFFFNSTMCTPWRDGVYRAIPLALFLDKTNSIGGLMGIVLAPSAVDRGFKQKTIKVIFVASPLNTQH
jgi:hypothetical protein